MLWRWWMYNYFCIQQDIAIEIGHIVFQFLNRMYWYQLISGSENRSCTIFEYRCESLVKATRDWPNWARRTPGSSVAETFVSSLQSSRSGIEKLLHTAMFRMQRVREKKEAALNGRRGCCVPSGWCRETNATLRLLLWRQRRCRGRSTAGVPGHRPSSRNVSASPQRMSPTHVNPLHWCMQPWKWIIQACDPLLVLDVLRGGKLKK